jgi:mRNA interferase RelE/StbE
LARFEWTEDALEDLRKLDRPVSRRIVKKISWLSQHFENLTPEPLSGGFRGTFKFRIGDWRAVYTIEPGLIVIRAVGHRREIYE